MICLPSTDLQEAEDLIERLRTNVGKEELTLAENVTVTITASFGLSVITQNKSLEDIITEADHALLCAKADGRNRVCIWNV